MFRLFDFLDCGLSRSRGDDREDIIITCDRGNHSKQRRNKVGLVRQGHREVFASDHQGEESKDQVQEL